MADPIISPTNPGQPPPPNDLDQLAAGAAAAYNQANADAAALERQLPALEAAAAAASVTEAPGLQVQLNGINAQIRGRRAEAAQQLSILKATYTQAKASGADPATVQAKLDQIQSATDVNEARLKLIEAQTELATARTKLAANPKDTSAIDAVRASQVKVNEARAASITAGSARAGAPRPGTATAQQNANTAAGRLEIAQNEMPSRIGKNEAQAAQAGARADYTQVQTQQLEQGPIVTLINQLKAGIKAGTLNPSAANDALSQQLGYGTAESRAAAMQTQRQAAFSQAGQQGMLVPQGFKFDQQGNLGKAFGKVGIDYQAPQTAAIPFDQWAQQIVQAAPQMQGGFDQQGNLQGLASTVASQTAQQAIRPEDVAANPAAYAGWTFVGGPLDSRNARPPGAPPIAAPAVQTPAMLTARNA